jgi:hypothetical protein
MQEQDGGVSDRQHADIHAQLSFTVLNIVPHDSFLFRPLSVVVRPNSLCTRCYKFAVSGQQLKQMGVWKASNSLHELAKTGEQKSELGGHQ